MNYTETARKILDSEGGAATRAELEGVIAAELKTLHIETVREAARVTKALCGCRSAVTALAPDAEWKTS